MMLLTVVLSMGSAGAVHLIVAPDHYSHSAAHGLFFALLGLAQIVWALSFWKKPKQSSFIAGLLLAGGSITLWTLTRFLPSPFEGVAGPIEFWGVDATAAEAMSLGGLLVLGGNRQRPAFALENRYLQSPLIALSLAILGGLIIFWAGSFAEPFFPGLAGEGRNKIQSVDDGHDHVHE